MSGIQKEAIKEEKLEKERRRELKEKKRVKEKQKERVWEKEVNREKEKDDEEVLRSEELRHVEFHLNMFGKKAATKYSVKLKGLRIAFMLTSKNLFVFNLFIFEQHYIKESSLRCPEVISEQIIQLFHD